MEGIVLDAANSNSDVMQLMQANNFSVNACRPFIASDGKSYISVPRINAKGEKEFVNVLTNNAATLRYDEWKFIDQQIQKVSLIKRVVVQDLIDQGCTRTIDGYSSSVLQWERMSDTTGASMDMDGETAGQTDGQTFDLQYLPLPIIHAEVGISDRQLMMSRKMNTPLDTTNLEAKAIKIEEYKEDLLMNGASAFKFGGGTIRGYLDYDGAHTLAFQDGTGTHYAWDSASCTNDNVVTDVQNMLSLAATHRSYGPWMIYVPQVFWPKLTTDYKTYGTITLVQRLKQLDPRILDIKVVPLMTAKKVCMVQMTPNVVELVRGMPLTTIQWQARAMGRHNFKLMTIEVPRLRTDANANGGIFVMA